MCILHMKMSVKIKKPIKTLSSVFCGHIHILSFVTFRHVQIYLSMQITPVTHQQCMHVTELFPLHTLSWKIQLNLLQGCSVSHQSSWPHAGHVIELSGAHVRCKSHGAPRSRSHPAAFRRAWRRLMKTSNNSPWSPDE